MDSDILAKSIASYLRVIYGNETNCFPMTYQERTYRLQERRYRETDIFILGLFRAYSEGLRAEALFAAEKMIKPWRKIAIISECAIAGELDCPIYWDMGSKTDFVSFFKNLMHNQTDIREEIHRLKNYFRHYCFNPRHGIGS